MAQAAGPIIKNVQILSRAGMSASAIWGYISTMVHAMDAMDTGGSGSSGGGSSGGSSSGQWENANESMSEYAAKYQQQITGRSDQIYRLNGVKFDGFDGSKLLEAKGHYSWALKNGKWADWFHEGMDQILNQARNQINAARGLTIEWHCAERDVAEAMRKLLSEKGFSSIRVIYTPPAAP